jgi:hypothetical protein
MSALGQEQTFSGRVPMYALPPKADILSQPHNARLVPKADIDSSKQFSVATNLFRRCFGIMGIKMVNLILPHLHKGAGR